MIAFISEGMNQEKTINIYDINSNSITKQVEIGKGNIYLNQWHNTDKILYNYEDSAYYLELESSNIELIGKYMFYPFLSPDSRYIAFSKPEEFSYYESLTSMGLYSYEDRGLYIVDLNRKKTKRISMDIDHDYIPILWLDN